MDKFLIRNINENDQKKINEREELLNKLEYGNTFIFGNKSFRDLQKDIILNILQNEDVFVILPTGGGKSLCYQLPAILTKGVTIVISPLLSLVEDQVSALIELPCGGIPAAYLSSASTETMIRSVFNDLDRACHGLEPYLKLLYITPERMVKSLATRQILSVLYDNEMLARFIIDEAHCVSSWGHDFRKDYGQLGLLKKEFPQTPIVALTATSRKQVSLDTMKILSIEGCKIFTGGYDRPNLKFEVCEKPINQADAHHFILQIVLSYPEGVSGILYCMTKNETEKLADYLRDNNILADYYHAGMTKSAKQNVQSLWLEGKIHIVCATIAYGMGIDKPDVRFVIHASLAKSLEGYYQEAGRAGRDGNRSDCILLYREKDVGALERVMLAPPKRKLSKVDIQRLEEMVEYCTNTSNCRRQTFSEIFGTNDLTSAPIKLKSSSFQRCGNMCDNCIARELSRNGSRSSSSLAPRHVYSPTGMKHKLKVASFTSAATLVTSNKSNSKNTTNTNTTISKGLFQTASGKNIKSTIINIDDDIDDDIDCVDLDDDISNNNNNDNNNNNNKGHRYGNIITRESETKKRRLNQTNFDSDDNDNTNQRVNNNRRYSSSNNNNSDIEENNDNNDNDNDNDNVDDNDDEGNSRNVIKSTSSKKGVSQRGKQLFQTAKVISEKSKKLSISNHTPRSSNNSKTKLPTQQLLFSKVSTPTSTSTSTSTLTSTPASIPKTPTNINSTTKTPISTIKSSSSSSTTSSKKLTPKTTTTVILDDD